MLKLALVDDHTLFRKGMKMLLDDFKDFENIYEASDGTEFLSLLQKEKIDIVFMDIEMPGINGIETTKCAKEIQPKIKIIALSMYGEEEYYSKMIEAGADGFILKDSTVDILKTAIDIVMSGKKYFSQEVLLNLVKKSNEKVEIHTFELSKREKEVLEFICKGMSNKEIARKLFLSKRTVDKHRENILSKTESKNTADLIICAMKNNLVDFGG